LVSPNEGLWNLRSNTVGNCARPVTQKYSMVGISQGLWGFF